MTISQAIQQLWVRSAKSQIDYASILGISREHLNAVASGREPGTPMMLERALQYAGLDWDACLFIPAPKELQGEDETALRIIRNALAMGGPDRLHVLEQAGVLQARQDERKRTRDKAKPEPVHRRK